MKNNIFGKKNKKADKAKKDGAEKYAEGSPQHEKLEGPKVEGMEHDSGQEPPDEYALDNAHKTLMDAENIKGNHHMMKHLKPHMEKKMGAMKKIMSIADLKKAAKEIE
jgi:hypothetical protein